MFWNPCAGVGNLILKRLGYNYLVTNAFLGCVLELINTNMSTHRKPYLQNPYISRAFSGVEAVVGLSQLERLDLSYTGVTNHGVHAVAGGCAALRRLNLDGCRVSILGMAKLFRETKKLRIWEEGIHLPEGFCTDQIYQKLGFG